jgi:aryl-alcohol dehydrogenase-like predicted oxidoreductase
MLEEVELGRSGLRAPALGFGCAALMGRTGKKDSLRALSAAWEEGIRLFDTARSYGYGESEALLGRFLKGKRDAAIVATKFGILSAPQGAWKRAAKSAARSLLSIVPPARSLVRRAAATQFSASQFTIPVLQRSIEESLTKLGTDYVDILFMHGAPASVLEQEDLLEAIGQLVDQGKVRLAGLSGEPAVVEAALEQQTPSLRAMQFPCNVFDISAAFRLIGQNTTGMLLAANHPFGGVMRVQACRTMLRELSANPNIDPVLREKLGDIEDQTLAEIVLDCILRNTGIHVVIPSMMRVEHVRANARAVSHSRFTDAEVRIIRDLLSAIPNRQSVGHQARLLG